MSGALDNKETEHLGRKKREDDVNDRRTHRYDGTEYSDVNWI